MVTQQLIDFIKQSSQQGATKEKITADLISNGWTLIDVEQGFSSLINTPVVTTSPIASPISTISNEPIITEKNHSNKKPIILTVVILLVLALGASGYYFRNDLPIVKDLIKSDTTKVGELTQNQTDQAIPEQPQQPETPVVTETTPTQDSSIKTEETPTSTVAPVVASNVVATKTGPIDCGKDMTCFTNAIKTCSPAVSQTTQVANIFGMFNETIKSTITLKGLNSSKKCGYESYVNDVSNLEYTPEMQAEIKAQIIKQGKNLTDEQMKEALKPSAEGLAQAKLSIGITTKCSFTTTYLTSLYTKWAKGEYSSDDLNPGNCTLTDSTGKVLQTLGTSSSSSKTDYGLLVGPINKEVIFSDKSISESDIGLTLLNITKTSENTSSINISVTKMSTKENQLITLNPNNEKSYVAVFGVNIEYAGYQMDETAKVSGVFVKITKNN